MIFLDEAFIYRRYRIQGGAPSTPSTPSTSSEQEEPRTKGRTPNTPLILEKTEPPPDL